MIRKRLYITESQEEAVKDHARRLGISESELTRRALHAFLTERSPEASRRSEALETLIERTRSLAQRHQLPSEYRFDREDLYNARVDQQSGMGPA
jgi:hypothetical protein